MKDRFKTTMTIIQGNKVEKRRVWINRPPLDKLFGIKTGASLAAKSAKRVSKRKKAA
ncbi:MAG: hypothetical protein IT462_04140 [Planctomycetes bacterium]|nr:hypothetical protein [Planctomycetota bacterium]